MRVLRRYILGELVRVWLLAFTALSLVFTLAVGLQRVHRVEVGFSLLLKILPLLVIGVFPYTIPIAAVLSATLVYGRLSADREIQALRAAGVHLARIVMPALLLGLCLSLVTTFLTLWVIPRSRYRVTLLTRSEVAELVESLLQGRIDRISRFRFQFARVQCNKMYKVVVFEYENGKPVREVVAAEVEPRVELDRQRLVFVLEDGSITDLTSTSVDKVNFPHHEVVIPLTGLKRPPRIKEMSIARLFREAARRTGEDKLRALVELYGRFARGLTPLVFLLIGAPIGIIVKQPHMLGAFALCCLPVFVVYYPLMMLMKALSVQGRALPEVAAWVPLVAVALIGMELLVVLFRR